MTQPTAKKKVFSGVQPTARLTLGNYAGALASWNTMQDEYDCIFSIVDMHAITVRQNPADLRRQTLETAAMYMACGIDPARSIIAVQSHVPQHTQLAWVLSCNTMFGELSRMTQFKDKSSKHADNVNAGLFTYPVLMAADILLYNADAVPVGDDQKQHIELARDVAGRFNSAYSPTFTLPEPYIGKAGARIMSLQEPTAKMSKSDENENATVRLTDEPDAIRRKFRRAVTDSEARVYRSEEKPGVSNLMSIYSAMTGKTYEEIEREFTGIGYGDFKLAVGESVVSTLAPIQQRYRDLLADRAALEAVLRDGAEKSRYMAQKMINKVYKKVGFIQI